MGAVKACAEASPVSVRESLDLQRVVCRALAGAVEAGVGVVRCSRGWVAARLYFDVAGSVDVEAWMWGGQGWRSFLPDQVPADYGWFPVLGPPEVCGDHYLRLWVSEERGA